MVTNRNRLAAPFLFYAAIAQLVEQSLFKRKVVRSNRAGGNIYDRETQRFIYKILMRETQRTETKENENGVFG